MKLAIVGSRGIENFDLSTVILEQPSEVISGGAKGVDSLAREYAIEHNIKLTEYLPDYAKYGRGAPIVRNRSIIEASDKVLAIWDGVSKGTLSSINLAKKLGKQVQIVRVSA